MLAAEWYEMVVWKRRQGDEFESEVDLNIHHPI